MPVRAHSPVRRETLELWSACSQQSTAARSAVQASTSRVDPSTQSGVEPERVVRDSSATVSVVPGDRHWQIFIELCRQVGARGNLVPDAFLAAMAIEQGATWVSADRGFAGFPRLRWSHPLDA